MTEPAFSINVSPGRTPQVTVRGNNVTDWHGNLEEFINHPEIPDLIARFCEQVNAGFAAAELTQPTAASAPASAPAVKAAQAAAGNVPGMFQYTDKDGATWTFQNPSAPDLPDGRPYKYAIKEGVSKSTDKPYKGLFDPATAYPQPTEFRFERGGEVKPIWKHAVL